MAKKSMRKKRAKGVPAEKETASSAYRDFAVALETVYSEIGAVGESLDFFRERTNERFESIEHKIDKLAASIEDLSRRLLVVEEKVDKLGKDMDFVKIEIRMVRHDLGQKVNREEFHLLEERVEKLEKELAVR